MAINENIDKEKLLTICSEWQNVLWAFFFGEPSQVDVSIQKNFHKLMYQNPEAQGD
jgi:hypothetical protein